MQRAVSGGLRSARPPRAMEKAKAYIKSELAGARPDQPDPPPPAPPEPPLSLSLQADHTPFHNSTQHNNTTNASKDANALPFTNNSKTQNEEARDYVNNAGKDGYSGVIKPPPDNNRYQDYSKVQQSHETDIARRESYVIKSVDHYSSIKSEVKGSDLKPEQDVVADLSRTEYLGVKKASELIVDRRDYVKSPGGRTEYLGVKSSDGSDSRSGYPKQEYVVLKSEADLMDPRRAEYLGVTQQAEIVDQRRAEYLGVKPQQELMDQRREYGNMVKQSSELDQRREYLRVKQEASDPRKAEYLGVKQDLTDPRRVDYSTHKQQGTKPEALDGRNYSVKPEGLTYKQQSELIDQSRNYGLKPGDIDPRRDYSGVKHHQVEQVIDARTRDYSKQQTELDPRRDYSKQSEVIDPRRDYSKQPVDGMDPRRDYSKQAEVLDQRREYKQDRSNVCFICGSRGHSEQWAVVARPEQAPPGEPHYPFLEGHAPPAGYRGGAGPARLVCRLCRALLRQQWDCYEREGRPHAQRLYWLKRVDGKSFTGEMFVCIRS